MTTRERDRRSAATGRSNRNVLLAREEVLKIKLQLRMVEKAEEEADSDDYNEDGQSKQDYVRSWLEEAPEPQPGPEDIDIVMSAPAQKRDVDGTQKIDSKEDGPPSQKMNVHQQGGDSLKAFITDLTSAVAVLADRKPPDTSIASPHPAVSKVLMTLPTFGGAHTEWLSFKAIYDITKNYFNDVENTARLRRNLKGRALETVSSELIGHARPEDIMKELKVQFGQPASSETDKLRALPRCSEAPKDICAFASKIRSGVVTLRALKKEHYLINAELVRVLPEKLPNSLRVQWYKTYTEKCNSKPDLGRFSDFVTEHARLDSVQSTKMLL